MKPRREVPQQDGTRRNEQIRAREVRVIGAEGEQIGILSKQEAIDLAKEHGLDRCKVTVFFRGREIVHKSRGQAILDRIVENTKDLAKVEAEQNVEGRTLQILLIPLGKK